MSRYQPSNLYKAQSQRNCLTSEEIPSYFKEPGSSNGPAFRSPPSMYLPKDPDNVPAKGYYYRTGGFGKYHDKTWYDIANLGQHSYLRWCNTTDVIRINDHAKKHILCALKTSVDPKAKWEELRAEEKNDTKVCFRAVVKGEEVMSPEEIVRKCKSCGKEKVVSESFKVAPEICNVCCQFHSAYAN